MACSASFGSCVSRPAAAERSFICAESFHAPTRVKMCEGMCSACGAEGAAWIEIVILPDGLDEVQLALALAAGGAGALERRFRPLGLRGIRPGREGVADQRGGNAPAGDGAVGVARQHFLECALALAEPEG